MKAGDALLDEGNYAGARSEYERALAVLEEDDFPIVYGALANTYMGEGNVAGAAEMADKALAVDPEFVPAMKIKCAIVASQGNLEEAEALLAKIPNDEVMHPNTLMNIGLAHFNKGDPKKPCGEPIAGVKAFQRPPRPDKGFLAEFLRQFDVAHQLAEERGHPPLVAPHEGAEGELVPVQGERHQFFIGNLRHRHKAS